MRTGNIRTAALLGAAVFITTAFSGALAQDIPASTLYPFRDNWERSWMEVNFSSFVFHDLNRNGVYDLGDRALAGIAVIAREGEIPFSVARSNNFGFANYAMSSSKPDMIISTPSSYSFEVVAPPGWEVTTGNAVQLRRIEEKPGSVSGLAAASLPDPVGLAQYLFVRGTYDGLLPAVVELWQDGRPVAAAPAAADGQFLIPAGAGDYLLKIGTYTRSVRIGRYPVDIGTTGSGLAEPAPATTLDFEDLAGGGLQKVPNGYAGLGWHGLNAFRADMYDDLPGYINATTSGRTLVYNSSAHPGEISAGQGFDLLSVNLGLSWPDAEGEEAVITYYRGETPVLTDRIGLSAYGPVSYRPRMADITRVVFETAHGWQLVLDDLEIAAR